MPRLTVRGPAGGAHAHRFEASSLTLGRGPSNDLVLDDPLLSRVHAEIRRSAEGWIVADRDSRNGVRVNGRPVIGACPLADGDEIAVGRTRLTFERDDVAPASDHAIAPTATTSGGRVGGGGNALVAGRSPAFRAILEAIDRIADSSATVLVTGENGTGKERVARLLHERSSRAAGPFVVVDCPAVPAALFEAELFGTERGVATGVDARAGLLETAKGGTVLLDEIGDLDLALQAKLLRVLQEKTIRRVGGRKPIPLDARIVAATNHDLDADVEAGTFRRDLHERLRVLTLKLPPLRERLEDVPALAEHFLGSPEGPRARLDENALAALVAHRYPGNVRELEHALEHARWHCKEGVIGVADLPESVRAPRGGGPVESLLARIAGGASFWDVVATPFLRRDVSREDAEALLAGARASGGGTWKGAARVLGIEAEHKRLLDFLHRHRLGRERPDSER